MVMPKEAYLEFNKLYEQEFGEKLTPSQTRLKADRLIKLFGKVLYTKEGEINERS